MVKLLIEISKNLLFIIKLDKFKKPNGNFFETEFLTLGAKKIFIYLQKAFIKVPILRYFDSKYYIYIKTNVLGYTIIEVLN